MGMPEEIQTIDGYLEQLKRHLAGADVAMVQDAVNDALEHIYNERAALEASGIPEVSEADLIKQVIESFGSPEEVTLAYRETEIKVTAALASHLPHQDESGAVPPRQSAPRAPSPWHQLFGVLIDPRAYSSVFYMLIGLPTGIFYFTWVVTGLSLSLGLSILIIGLPFFLLFLATARALSLVEGRIVETLLGERMPRRADQTLPSGSWFNRVKFWLTDIRSWSTLLYMLLRLPLGVFSFSLFVTLLALTASFFAVPILYMLSTTSSIRLFHDPSFSIVMGRPITALTLPFFWMASAVTWLLTLHMAKLVGRISGWLAKVMLVRV